MVDCSKMIVSFMENDNWTKIHTEENAITDTDSIDINFEYCDKLHFTNNGI